MQLWGTGAWLLLGALAASALLAALAMARLLRRALSQDISSGYAARLLAAWVAGGMAQPW